MKEKLDYLNQMLGYLIDELKTNNLFDKMNLIITSDHGMETTSPQNTINLPSIIDIDLVDVYGGACVSNIFVKNSKLIALKHFLFDGVNIFASKQNTQNELKKSY